MIVGLVILAIVIAIRIYISFLERKKEKISAIKKLNYGMAQTYGDCEIQSDCMYVFSNESGQLAVLADGIGKQNTGKISAQMAVDIFVDMFRQYKTLENPAYFFKKGFHVVHQKIRQTIDERRGGTSIAVVYVNRENLFYALAGDIMIVLYRNEDMISLTEGHTVDVLANQAYMQGKITKQEAIWSLKQKRLWNYVGMDGFHEIEIFDTPIKLKEGDQILLMSKGIFHILPLIEIEDIIKKTRINSEQKASEIVKASQKIKTTERENGSVIILEINRWVS